MIDELEEMRRVLIDLYRPVWISIVEDERINAVRMNSRVPDGWTATDGPFVRYQAVEIELVKSA